MAVESRKSNDEEEIAALRKQIRKLTHERRLLTATALSTTRIQKALARRAASEPLLEDDLPIISSSTQHAESNIHRLAFQVTTFPFVDPSPTSLSRLLGVRFEFCGRDGRFIQPYYILLKRIGPGNTLRIYRHTIPVFIPLRELEDRYLPMSHDETLDDIPYEPHRPQRLHSLVIKVRHELYSWILRREAVEMLQEELGLNDVQGIRKDEAQLGGEAAVQGIEEIRAHPTDHPIKLVEETSVEARYVRLVWNDGRVGRIKIHNDGSIDSAVVIGLLGTRDLPTERLLANGQTRIDELAEVLRKS